MVRPLRLLAVCLLSTALRLPAADATAPVAPAPRWDEALAAAAIHAHADLWVAADASDLPDDGLLHARIGMAASGPRMTLCYPHWIPGTHAPSGPVQNLGGLVIHDDQGRRLEWNRDSRDAWNFIVEVPTGARRLVIDLTYIANQPTINSEGVDIIANSGLALINWNTCVLYPQGAAAAHTTCVSALRLPAGWQWASALAGEGDDTDDGVVAFSPTTLEELIDRPVLAGTTVNHRRLHAADSAGPEVLLDVASADPDGQLRDDRWLTGLGRLPDEAFALFGGARYDMLLLLSGDSLGLEHGSCSVNGIGTDTLDFAKVRLWHRELMPHEFVHSWVGKLRRPRAMLVDDYQTPPQYDGLWIYEGLTEYLGRVLAVRCGLATAGEWRQALAGDIRTYADEPGRQWRSLRDTCRANWQLRGWSRFHGELRRGQDFYGEGALFWLAADLRIRATSNGERSLDTFCRAFFGPGGPPEQGFDEDQLVAALNQVCPSDWNGLIKCWIDSTGDLDTTWLDTAGWTMADHLVTTDEVKGGMVISTKRIREALGIELSKEGWVHRVVPDSPADRAGLQVGDLIHSIGDIPLKDEPLALALALVASPGTKAIICRTTRDRVTWTTRTMVYAAGVKIGDLAPIPGHTDLLGAILAPHAPPAAAQSLPAGAVP